MRIRPATASDRDKLEWMLRESPQTPQFGHVDMTGSEHYWLLAEKDDEIMACMMCVAAIPFGFVEFLLTRPEMSQMDKGRAVSMLTNVAHHVLAKNGCTFVLGVIPKAMKEYRKVARRRGYVPMNTCSFMIKRLK